MTAVTKTILAAAIVCCAASVRADGLAHQRSVDAYARIQAALSTAAAICPGAHTNNMLAPEMEKEFGIDSRDLPRLREVAGQEFESVISPLLKSWGAASWCTSIRHVFGPYGTVRPNALLFDAGDR